jgi:ElaB/YqjD/DUF883 family membrane-anchored ribosome-binding protein
MDINNRSMDVSLPSGLEVDSAVFHPVIDTSHQLPAADHSGMRHKLDDLRSRGMAKVQSMQRMMSDRVSTMRTSMRDGVSTMKTSMRDGMTSRKSQLQSTMTNTQSQMNASMRSNPMMWAGIAGGTGMALGLVGRFLHWRANRPMPDLVIIDAC